MKNLSGIFVPSFRRNISSPRNSILKHFLRLFPGQMVKRIKTARPGRVTRNAFINFVQEYRHGHSGRPMAYITAEGAKLWRQMDRTEKAKYLNEASNAPRKRRKYAKTRS